MFSCATGGKTAHMDQVVSDLDIGKSLWSLPQGSNNVRLDRASKAEMGHKFQF